MTVTGTSEDQDRLSQAALFWLATIVSVGFSVGGIACALMLKAHPGVVAERGGAIGSATAFLTLFAGRNYGQRLFLKELKRRPELRASLIKLVEGDPLPKSDSDWLLYALVSRLILDVDEQKLQTRFLVGASVIGTIVWGFGGWFVSIF